ncbi:hypothetical protein V6Z11_A03G172400 [Gossypium hirsutum]
MSFLKKKLKSSERGEERSPPAQASGHWAARAHAPPYTAVGRLKAFVFLGESQVPARNPAMTIHWREFRPGVEVLAAPRASETLGLLSFVNKLGHLGLVYFGRHLVYSMGLGVIGHRVI